MPTTDPLLEHIREIGFPTVEQLRRGILLGCVAGSFWLVAHEPVFEKSWEGDTYLDDEWQGERWAVSFPKGGAVAVFYSTESSRNPYPEGRPPYDLPRYFRGMPEHLAPAKEQALSWMQNLDSQTTGPIPVITAAMWADGNQFTSVEPWADVFDHSGQPCYQQLLPPEIALQEWWNGMELPGAGIRAVRSLYERRIASAEAVIAVESWEWQMFVEAAGKPPDAPNLAAVRELLGGVGIALPWLKG